MSGSPTYRERLALLERHAQNAMLALLRRWIDNSLDYGDTDLGLELLRKETEAHIHLWETLRGERDKT